MVDNGSIDDVVDRVRVELPDDPRHRTVRQHRVRRRVQPRHPGPGPLRPDRAGQQRRRRRSRLAAPARRRARADPRVGAVMPEDALRRPVRRGRASRCRMRRRSAATADARRPVRSALRMDGERADERLAFDEGFFPPEAPDRRGGRGDARLVVAARAHPRAAVDGDGPGSRLSLRVVASEPRTVRRPFGRRHRPRAGRAAPEVDRASRSDGDAVRRHQQRRVGAVPERVRRRPRVPRARRGQYDEPADVFAWCGGAVLLSARVPRRRRAVRRAAVPLLRGHRPVLAGSAAWLELPLRAHVGRAPPPRPVVGRRVDGRSASTPSATARWCWPRTRRPDWPSGPAAGLVADAVRVTVRDVDRCDR